MQGGCAELKKKGGKFGGYCEKLYLCSGLKIYRRKYDDYNSFS